MNWFRRKSLIVVALLAFWGASLSAGPGDVKLVYGTATNLTITALQVPIASSQTWVAGWESLAIDNTTTTYCAIGPCLDFRITAMLKVAASNNQAGELRLYLVGMLDDSTWPDVFDGTESAETITDTEMRDAIALLCASSVVDTGASDIYYLDCPSVAATFRGNMPAKFVIYITGNPTTTTTAAFATSGSQVTVKGVSANVAQS